MSAGPIRFELPSLGADMDEGTLLEWKVRPGERVERGQVVAVVDTSKAAVEVEIWQPGVVAELLVQPGQKIPVGTVMATLFAPGEAKAAAVEGPPPEAAGEAAAVAAIAAGTATGAAASVPAPAPVAAPVAAPAVAPAVAPAGAPTQELRAPAAPARVPAPLARAGIAAPFTRRPVSPAARKRARECGLDPDALEGTGADGAVTLADVERAAAAAAAIPEAVPPQGPSAVAAAAGEPAPVAAPQAAPIAAPAASPATVRPATPIVAPGTAPAAAPADRRQAMRAAIAAAMARSKREIPHYYLAETIPMAHALGWLAERNAGLPVTERILPAVLQLKAVALALARVPELNGFFRDGAFQPAVAVHAGVAIALRGGGLVAPALHDVRTRTLEDLMRGLADLVRRARAGSLRSSEMSDPTITVTNLGDQGVESVFGVIYPPQVALVGFGRIAERAWAQDGWIRPMPVVTASLAADHRVSDGHRGALFLAELRDWLQHPQELADAR